MVWSVRPTLCSRLVHPGHILLGVIVLKSPFVLLLLMSPYIVLLQSSQARLRLRPRMTESWSLLSQHHQESGPPILFQAQKPIDVDSGK